MIRVVMILMFWAGLGLYTFSNNMSMTPLRSGKNGKINNCNSDMQHETLSLNSESEVDPTPFTPAFRSVSKGTSSSMRRMVFTHVGKTGGSYFINLMESFAAQNEFTMVKGAIPGGFMPSKEKLLAQLNAMKNNSVYENHANYVLGLDDPEGWQWVSVLREPIDLMNSLFYYAVDVEIRGDKAMAEIEKRTAEGVCGCANLEFDACIDTRYEYNCTLELPKQTLYFCEPKDPNCTGELALEHVKAYALVGITEEMDLTMEMLKKLIPWVFDADAPKVSKRGTNLFNPVTNTSKNGAISTRARKQLKERANNYEEETEFYNQVKRMFWKKAAELAL